MDLFVTDGDEGVIEVLGPALPLLPAVLPDPYAEGRFGECPRRARREVNAAPKGIFAQPSREKARVQLDAFRARNDTLYP